MLPIKMMKVDPMRKDQRDGGGIRQPPDEIAEGEETWIEQAEEKRKADQYDQRPKLCEPAPAEPTLKNGTIPLRSALLWSGIGHSRRRLKSRRHFLNPQ